MHWHQTAAGTSQTRIILQPTSDSYASLWSIPKQEMADCLDKAKTLSSKAKTFIRCPRGQQDCALRRSTCIHTHRHLHCVSKKHPRRF